MGLHMQAKELPSYVLITPARNEAEFIELTQVHDQPTVPPTEGPWFSGRKATSKKAELTLRHPQVAYPRTAVPPFLGRPDDVAD